MVMVACLCLFTLLFCTPLCAEGVRKDRVRVVRRDKRQTGNGGRHKGSKDLEQKTAPPQDRKKHTSTSSAGGGGKSSVIGMSPEQVSSLLVLNRPKTFRLKISGSVTLNQFKGQQFKFGI